MALGALATILLVVVLYQAFTRKAYMLAVCAVLLGIAAATLGGALATAGSGVLGGVGGGLSTIQGTAFDNGKEKGK